MKGCVERHGTGSLRGLGVTARGERRCESGVLRRGARLSWAEVLDALVESVSRMARDCAVDGAGGSCQFGVAGREDSRAGEATT